MIININLTGNVVHYYDIKKDKSAEGHSVYLYRSFITKKEDVFPVLKDIIIAKKEVDAEFFVTKMNKVFKYDLAHTRSFGQTAKHIVSLMNSYRNTTNGLKQSLVLSILYLDGKPLPKIEKICLIDNNMYFIIKYKNEYTMHAATDENMKCIMPLSNIFSLYKKLKKTNYIKKKIRKKPNSKSTGVNFQDIGSTMFQMDEIVRLPTASGITTNNRRSTPESREHRPTMRSFYRPPEPVEQDMIDEDEADPPQRLLERHSQPELVEQLQSDSREPRPSSFRFAVDPFTYYTASARSSTCTNSSHNISPREQIETIYNPSPIERLANRNDADSDLD
jgi:hypothetical protein